LLRCSLLLHPRDLHSFPTRRSSDLAFLKSSSVRTKGSITWTLVSLYSSLTFLIARHSNRKMSGSFTYRKQPRYPSNGLGPTWPASCSYFSPPGRPRNSSGLKSRHL